MCHEQHKSALLLHVHLADLSVIANEFSSSRCHGTSDGSNEDDDNDNDNKDKDDNLCFCVCAL